MSKKFILLTAVLGLVSLAGSFTLTWFTIHSRQKVLAKEQNTQETEQNGTEAAALQKNPNYEPSTKYLTEQQLNNLIHELRNNPGHPQAGHREAEQLTG